MKKQFKQLTVQNNTVSKQYKSRIKRVNGRIAGFAGKGDGQ